MEENDEKLLNEFIESRNLSLRTYQGYKDALKKYILFQNESFYNLLLEADLEEENRIRWKNRKIKQRLIDFRLFLYNNYMYNAAKVYFQRILTLYRHFEIEIHNLPKISNKSSKNYVITFEDLPTKEIIKNALEITNSVMRALILFIISSGCGRRESLNLTIDDFIEATYEYHKEKDIKKALLILKDLENVVPTFKITRQKTNKFYFTFCSPEASKEIINYLLEERKLNGSDKLFKINLDYLNTNFDKINKELGLKKVGTYRRFRCHMLRKFHASALYNANNGLSLDEIDSLQGRFKDKTHSSYFMENPNLLKEKYINSLDAITIN